MARDGQWGTQLLGIRVSPNPRFMENPSGPVAFGKFDFLVRVHIRGGFKNLPQSGDYFAFDAFRE